MVHYRSRILGYLLMDGGRDRHIDQRYLGSSDGTGQKIVGKQGDFELPERCGRTCQLFLPSKVYIESLQWTVPSLGTMWLPSLWRMLLKERCLSLE